MDTRRMFRRTAWFCYARRSRRGLAQAKPPAPLGTTSRSLDGVPGVPQDDEGGAVEQYWDMRRVIFAACFVALAAYSQTAHQHHPPQSAEEYAHILEDPSRDAWQKPHEVIMALAIRPEEVIADLGAGSGYFARRFAK